MTLDGHSEFIWGGIQPPAPYWPTVSVKTEQGHPQFFYLNSVLCCFIKGMLGFLKRLSLTYYLRESLNF